MEDIVYMNAGLGEDDESVEAFAKSYGKTIIALCLVDDDKFRLSFEDGTQLSIYDAGQSCCETRYMRTDDNLADYVGAQLLGGEIRDAPNIDDGGEVHEVQFLALRTSRGVITFSSHNEHNGYYGGFCIRCRLEEV